MFEFSSVGVSPSKCPLQNDNWCYHSRFTWFLFLKISLIVMNHRSSRIIDPLRLFASRMRLPRIRIASSRKFSGLFYYLVINVRVGHITFK